MNNLRTIFFYGLFMDPQYLRAQGLQPQSVQNAYVQDYELQLGARANLIASVGQRCYGVVMTLTAQEVTQLYAAPSVQDYQAETVSVHSLNQPERVADVYLLQGSQQLSPNQDYAHQLLQLAQQLDFPTDYLQHIASFIVPKP